MMLTLQYRPLRQFLDISISTFQHLSASFKDSLWLAFVANADNIFALWFLLLLSSSFLSLPNLSGCRVDVYHTSTHDVALMQI